MLAVLADRTKARFVSGLVVTLLVLSFRAVDAITRLDSLVLLKMG